MLWLIFRSLPVPGQQIPQYVDTIEAPTRSAVIIDYRERYLYDETDGTILTFVAAHEGMRSSPSYFRVSVSVPEISLTNGEYTAVRNAVDSATRLGDRGYLRSLLEKAEAQKKLIEINERGAEITR